MNTFINNLLGQINYTENYYMKNGADINIPFSITLSSINYGKAINKIPHTFISRCYSGSLLYTTQPNNI